MTIDSTHIEKISHLARLQINHDDIPAYVKNLNDILQLVDEMSRVNTDGIQPMAHPLDAHQRLRKDEVTETDQHVRFQSIAPATEAGLYLVPQVIE